MKCKFCPKEVDFKKYSMCFYCRKFRYGLSDEEFISHSKKIRERQMGGRRTDNSTCSYDKTTLSKRRYNMKRRDREHRNCSGDIVSTSEFFEFLKRNRCFYCGECATGIDRLNNSLDCYPVKLTKDTIAACFTCNNMRWKNEQTLFIEHMVGVANSN